MRVAGERWWPATLLLFLPRWVWAAPLLLLLPVVLVLRRRSIWLPLGCGLFSLFALMGLHVPLHVPWGAAPAGATAHVRLRVLTCNLHRTQANRAVLDAFITETQPDLIALQDASSKVIPSCLKQGGWYQDRYGELYLISRYPIHIVEYFPLGAFRVDADWNDPMRYIGTAGCWRVEGPAGVFHFVNLHLSSPHRALGQMPHDWELAGQMLRSNSQRRQRESQIIRQDIARLGEPIVLAGDFNTPCDSPIFRRQWSDLGDAFSAAAWGFGISYAKHYTWLRIDHILYDRGWTCRQCRAGPDVGSGHRAVFAELER